MIVVSKNNYRQLEKIPHIEDPKSNPDVIFYKNIFTTKTVIRMTTLLESIKFNENGKIWFSDNPLLNYDNKLSAQPFPLYIEQLREDVEKITGISFNSCLVTLYENKENLLYNIHNKSINKSIGKNIMIPSILFGSNRTLIYESLVDSGITKELQISSGSLLVERESVKDYWDVSLVGSDSVFYNLSFYYVYKKNDLSTVVKSKSKASIKKKLPLKLSKIYLNSKMRMGYMKRIRLGLSVIR